MSTFVFHSETIYEIFILYSTKDTKKLCREILRFDRYDKQEVGRRMRQKSRRRMRQKSRRRMRQKSRRWM